MSLDLDKDVKILMFCRDQARNRYQIAKHSGNHYAAIFKRIEKLVKLGVLTVTKEKEWRSGPRTVKYFLITEAGMAILRGVKEAYRRE